jgi:hypothetical protein
MRILIYMFILSGGLAAQDATKTTPPAAASKTQKAPAAALTVPKDAVQTEPGVYRWTDKSGKVWTYRQTPFGVKRWSADSVDTERKTDKRISAEERTTAVEQGDSIRFEQFTPFGKHTWVRKKSEMNEAEQKIWDRQQKNSTASRVAEKE